MELLGVHSAHDVASAWITANGARVFVWSSKGHVRLLDTTHGETLLALAPGDRVVGGVVERDLAVIRLRHRSGEGPGDVALWNVTHVRPVLTLTPADPRPIGFDIGKDAVHVLSGDGTLETTRFDGRTERRAGESVSRSGGVLSGGHVLAPDERFYAFGSARATAWIYDLDAMQVHGLPGAPIDAIQQAHTARVRLDQTTSHLVVHAHAARHVRVWNVAERRLVPGPWSDVAARDVAVVGVHLAWIADDEVLTCALAGGEAPEARRVSPTTRLVHVDDRRFALVSSDVVTSHDLHDGTTASLPLPKILRQPTVVSGGAGHLVVAGADALAVVRA